MTAFLYGDGCRIIIVDPDGTRLIDTPLELVGELAPDDLIGSAWLSFSYDPAAFVEEGDPARPRQFRHLTVFQDLKE